MAFTPRCLATVAGFAAQLGLPAQTAADGSFNLVFAAKGRLSVTPSRDGRRVVMSLSREPRRLDADVMQRALAAAGHDASTDRVYGAGIDASERLYFAVGLDEAEVSLPLIETCLQHLAQLHDA